MTESLKADKMGLRSFGAGYCRCRSTSHWTWDWPPEREKIPVQLSSYAYVCIPHYHFVDCTYYASLSVLNDSALAVILSANNDRHLFFQGPQGVIRRMIYRTNNNQWIADPGSIAISDAKNLTPLAVSRYEDPDFGDTEEVMLSFQRYGRI